MECLEREPGAALLIAPDREAAARWAQRLDAPRARQRRLGGGAPPGLVRGLPRAQPRRGRHALGAARAAAAARDAGPDRRARSGPQAAGRAAAALARPAPAAGRARRQPPRSCSPPPRRPRAGGTRGRAGSSGRTPRPRPGREVITADTRGILRNHPLTLPLTRAIEDMSRQGRRAVLIVSRRTSALACDECGAVLRCPDCGVALALARDRSALRCPLCARADAPPDHCPACGGHRLSPFGWDPERVQTSVARRFPRLTVSRQSLEAQVLIGTPALLRALPRRSVGCVGFVALDGLLRVPDFRAGERTWQLLWAAAESVTPGGRLVIQTQHPEHYAVRAVQAQDRAELLRGGAQVPGRARLPALPPARRGLGPRAGGRPGAGPRRRVRGGPPGHRRASPSIRPPR